MANMTERARKAAPFALTGLLIMAAGLIVYYLMPRPIGGSTPLLAICIFAGFLIMAIGLYFFLASDTMRRGLMTGRMKGAAFILVGVVSIVAGLFYYYVLPEPYGLSIGAVAGSAVTGVVFITAGAYVYLKDAQLAVVDERTLRVQSQAGYTAFILSYVLLLVLFILKASGVLSISYELIVLVLSMAMPWIFLVMRFILGRKGETI